MKPHGASPEIDTTEGAIVRRHVEAWRSEGLLAPEHSANLLARLARGTSATAIVLTARAETIRESLKRATAR